MTLLTIEQILAADATKIEEVQCPEWGGSVYVRRLSALESVTMGRCTRDLTKANPGPDGRTQAVLAASLSAYMCDEKGAPMVTLEQAQAIIAKPSSGPAVDRIFQKGHELNGEGVEAVAKNSEPSPSV